MYLNMQFYIRLIYIWLTSEVDFFTTLAAMFISQPAERDV